MFKQGKKLLYLLVFLPFLTSCDNIPEDDRYIDTGAVNVARKVLLEEFTGQRCTNCPDAHQIIERLEDQYGDDLIVVSIHAGPFGIAAPDGLMVPTGEEYASRWNISAYPAGVVDREGGVLSPDGWANAIRTQIGKISPVDISVDASLVGDSIEVTSTVSSSEALKASLQLWVTQDSIVGFQIDDGTRIPDYVHNNVFRGCVNGTWGQPLEIAPNIYNTLSNRIAVDPEWDVKNLHIVGFVYDSSGVIQADKTAIKIK